MKVYLILREGKDSRRTGGFRTRIKTGTLLHAQVLQLSDECLIDKAYYSVIMRTHNFDKGELKITLQKHNIK